MFFNFLLYQIRTVLKPLEKPSVVCDGGFFSDCCRNHALLSDQHIIVFADSLFNIRSYDRDNKSRSLSTKLSVHPMSLPHRHTKHAPVALCFNIRLGPFICHSCNNWVSWVQVDKTPSAFRFVSVRNKPSDTKIKLDHVQLRFSIAVLEIYYDWFLNTTTFSLIMG